MTRSPDFSDDGQNCRRKALLLPFRGPIGAEIPNDTTWEEVSLTSDEFTGLRLINYPTWVILSDHTGLLSTVAENLSRALASHPTPAAWRGPHEQELLVLREKIRTKLDNSIELSEFRPILIRQTDSDSITVVDGYHRAVAP